MFKVIYKLIVPAIFLFIFTPSWTQDKYFEIGGGIGITSYSGDLSPPTIGQVLGTSGLGLNSLIRYNLHPMFSVKALASYGQINAKDSRSHLEWQQQRNLSFYSSIYEFGISGEWNIFGFTPLLNENIFTVYLMGGVSGFYFNPRAEVDGQWFQLQSLGTEGQGLESYPEKDFYSLYELAIPFGGGIKLKLTESLNFNLELGWRMTFTDYLDDVSETYPDYNILLEERGAVAADLSHGLVGNGSFEINNPNSGRGSSEVNDYYVMLTVGLTYNLVNYGFNNVSGFKRKSRHKLGCPKF